MKGTAMTHQELFDDWYSCRSSLIWEYSTAITSDRIHLHLKAVRTALELGLEPPAAPDVYFD